ncbi:MAG: hypothetical protein EBY31_07950, partial [Flavobacteriia bacterium]|nr:hypothetical protein [Flavobacteriia bacterium]
QSVNNDSIVSFDSRTSSVRKKQNKAVDEIKKADKGYHCVKCIVNHRTIKVEVYDSGTTIGNKIRDPIYGNRLPAKVGSKDENLFFKVRMAGLNTTTHGGPVTLFYDSPEHYERHFKTHLSTFPPSLCICSNISITS